jgi:hypothetical protein
MDTTDAKIFGVFLLIILTLILLIWYSSGKQAELYHKQGINISHLDVFLGVKPNESVIQLKNNK